MGAGLQSIREKSVVNLTTFGESACERAHHYMDNSMRQRQQSVTLNPCFNLCRMLSVTEACPRLDHSHPVSQREGEGVLVRYMLAGSDA